MIDDAVLLVGTEICAIAMPMQHHLAASAAAIAEYLFDSQRIHQRSA